MAAVDDDQRRLDRILRKALPKIPLSALHRLLRKGNITVDGQKASLQMRIQKGQLIEIRNNYQKKSLISEPESDGTGSEGGLEKGHFPVIPLPAINIIYEGKGLLILNKPPGMAVHGENSMQSMVNKYLESKLLPSLSFKPGPLHRLDKPTSGLLVFSMNLHGARFFSTLLRERKVKKIYLAVTDNKIEGKINNEEIWKDNLGRDKKLRKTFLDNASGTEAITRIKPLKSSETHTLITAEIETGITHQIRAQAFIHGHPLSGDRKYGSVTSGHNGNFLLHAWKLELDETELLPGLPGKFTAPLPDYFMAGLVKFFGKDIMELLENQP